MSQYEKAFYWAFVPLVAATLPLFLGWKPVARANGWVSSSDCPGRPMRIEITSPGDGVRLPRSVVGVDALGAVRSPFIVEASRKIPRGAQVGLLTIGSGDKQYYLRFWSDPKVIGPSRIRADSIRLSIDDLGAEFVEVRAVLVENRLAFGSQYTSVEQVRSNGSLIAISDPIKLFVSR